MEEAKSARMKIFLWDQFVRPIRLLFNIHILQALLLALLILNIVVWRNMWAFAFLVISLGIIFFVQIFEYYKSGEFMHNYRKYKSERGEYGDYRKLTKVLKKSKEEKIKEAVEDLNDEYEDLTQHEVNIGKCEKCGKDWIMDNGGNWVSDCNCDKEVKEGDEQ